MKKIWFGVILSLLFMIGTIIIQQTQVEEMITAEAYREQLLSNVGALKELKLSDAVVLKNEDFMLEVTHALDQHYTINSKFVEELSNSLAFLEYVNEVMGALIRVEYSEEIEQDETLDQSGKSDTVPVPKNEVQSYLKQKPTFKLGEKLYETATLLNEQLFTYKILNDEFKNKENTTVTESDLQTRYHEMKQLYMTLLDVFFNEYYPVVYDTLSGIGYVGVKATPVARTDLQLNIINYLSISDRYYAQTQAFVEDVSAYLDLLSVIDEYEDIITLTSGTGHYLYAQDLEALKMKVDSIEHLNNSLSYQVQMNAEKLEQTTLILNPLLVEKLVLADIELKEYYMAFNKVQEAVDKSEADKQLTEQFMILHALMQSIYKDLEESDGIMFNDMSQQIVAASTEI